MINFNIEESNNFYINQLRETYKDLIDEYKEFKKFLIKKESNSKILQLTTYLWI